MATGGASFLLSLSDGKGFGVWQAGLNVEDGEFNMMKKLISRYLVICSILFIAPSAFAVQCADVFAASAGSRLEIATVRRPVSTYLRVGPERDLVKFEYQRPQNGKPTFFMLPGSIRGMRSTDKMLELIGQDGFGWVSINYSRHPESLVIRSKEDSGRPMTPRKDDQMYSRGDIIREIEAVRSFVRNQLGVSDIIPVTLSFSGMLSPHFKNEKVMFEMVPMTSTDAAAPEAAAYRQSLEMGRLLNPFFGEAAMRMALDEAYRSVWGQRVREYSDRGEIPRSLIREATEAYVELVRTSEGVDLLKSDNPAQGSVRRVFILAENESPALLRHQLERFEQVRRDDSRTLLVMVKNAGHVVTHEQPQVMAEIFKALHERLKDSRGGILEANPLTGQITE